MYSRTPKRFKFVCKHYPSIKNLKIYLSERVEFAFESRLGENLINFNVPAQFVLASGTHKT